MKTKLKNNNYFHILSSELYTSKLIDNIKHQMILLPSGLYKKGQDLKFRIVMSITKKKSRIKPRKNMRQHLNRKSQKESLLN